MLDLLWLIPAPIGRGRHADCRLATATTVGSFGATFAAFVTLLSRPAGELRVDAGLLADPLSLTMALFVTGIGAAITLYAVGYMRGDDRFPAFFSYLNLFVFSMLVLVLADSFPVMFVGREGVGSLSFAGVFDAAPALARGTATAAALLFLLGAASRRSCRCSCGCPMPWRVQRRFRRSCTPPRW